MAASPHNPSRFVVDLLTLPVSRWLANWLLDNNPNKPVIAHADDRRPGDDLEEQEEAGELGENQVLGMVKTVESRLQE